METDARFCFFFLLFNQNYNKSLESDCLSPAQFGHCPIGQCMHYACYWMV